MPLLGRVMGYKGDDQKIVTEESGEKVHLKFGVPHRDDGPAIIEPDGTQIWCKYGATHREGGPAIIKPDGTRHWVEWDQLQRIEMPDGRMVDASKVVGSGHRAQTVSP